MESTPVDEPTVDSDAKQARIERTVMTWQTARNANGKRCVLCESREQDPECAGKLCFACCDSTRIHNYNCSACCEPKKARVGYTSEKGMELNDTTVSPSRSEPIKNCGFYMMKKREWICKGCQPLHKLAIAIQSKPSQTLATKRESSAQEWYCDLESF